jgi:hypothetical protein
MILVPVSVFKNGVFIVRLVCELFRLSTVHHIYAVVIAAFETKAFRNIDTQCFESAPFWCRSGSEFPFWIPVLPHLGKSDFFFSLSHSIASLTMIFLIIVNGVIIFSILDIILKFSGKKYCLSSCQPYHLHGIYTDPDPGKTTRIWPDPDPQHC